MRFLIFGGPGIGDTIMELSMAKALKQAYPYAEIDIMLSNTLGASKVVDNLLACQDYVDNYYCYSKKKLCTTIRTLLRLRLRKYDYSFACTTSFKASHIPSKISHIIGCKSIMKEVKGKTGKIDIPVNIPENIHFIEQNQELCRLLIPNCKLDILVLNKDKISDFITEKFDNNLITICFGTNATIYWKNGNRISKNIKSWATNRWIKLANELFKNGYSVAIIGGEKERIELDNSNEKLENGIKNYLGKTSIQQSLGIIQQSQLVIGADTGMMHCAAALDKKTVTLFGGTDANVWRPYSEKGIVVSGSTECSPCYGKEYAIKCEERKCMNTIDYDRILKIVMKEMRK